ncbi:Uncharacterised protein [Mycobacterium tuberculosis]|nr:Uncharacterised protein [Mycobacterium tuberculosis]
MAAAASHPVWRAACAAIIRDDGPCHQRSARPEHTDSNEAAANHSSAANSSQAAAAADSDPGPPPAYIRAEFTSGDNVKKSAMTTSRRLGPTAAPPLRRPRHRRP